MQVEVDAFLQSNRRNAWITDGIVNVYVRKSRRVINSVWVEMFDIANVQVDDQLRGLGYFKAFILYIESLNFNIYVESVLNSDLRDMLLKYDYIETTSGESLYRLVH